MNEKSPHYILGIEGEKKAQEYLILKGYKILEKNYDTPYGEIDLIAVSGKSLCFIEVKTRCSRKFAYPSDSVDRKRRRRLINAALFFSEGTKRKYLEHRFDIVEVLYEYDGSVLKEINIIEDAFDLNFD